MKQEVFWRASTGIFTRSRKSESTLFDSLFSPENTRRAGEITRFTPRLSSPNLRSLVVILRQAKIRHHPLKIHT